MYFVRELDKETLDYPLIEWEKEGHHLDTAEEVLYPKPEIDRYISSEFGKRSTNHQLSIGIGTHIEIDVIGKLV